MEKKISRDAREATKIESGGKGGEGAFSTRQQEGRPVNLVLEEAPGRRKR